MPYLQQLLQPYLPYLLIAAGILFIVYSIFKKSAAEKLKGKGIYTDAIIFKQGYKRNSYDDDFTNAPDKITVRFTTKSNEWITTIAKNEFGMYYTNQYKDGENVRILYNPENPKECTLITKQSEDTTRIVLIIIGVVVIVGGVYLLFKM